MNIEIKTFDNLLTFIETNELKESEIIVIIENTIGIYIAKNFNKNKLIRKLIFFWSEWSDKPIAERPLFLDIDF